MKGTFYLPMIIISMLFFLVNKWIFSPDEALTFLCNTL